MKLEPVELDAIAAAVAELVSRRLAGAGPAAGAVAPRLLNVDQAATYLGRTKEAVQHMIAAGKLPTVRLDRRMQIDVRDLDRWIEDNKQQPVV